VIGSPGRDVVIQPRLGAELVEVALAYVRILARRPVRTLPHTQAVAAELWP
jgi:hypothetical protein